MNNLNPEEEKALIQRIQGGEKEAFRFFIDQYKKLVFHIVYKTAANRIDPDDLSQEIFIKLYRNLSGFRNECTLSTWVAKIAYNTCLNALKKKKVPLLSDMASDLPFRIRLKAKPLFPYLTWSRKIFP